MATFNNLDHWYNEIKSQCESDSLIVLVGNQYDKSPSMREVSVEKALAYKAEKGLDYFIETSAKTSYNVQEAFITVAKMLYRKHRDKIT